MISFFDGCLIYEDGYDVKSKSLHTSIQLLYLKINDTGTIQAGKRADLVVLSVDPLKDIRNTTKIETVVLQGRWLNRKSLDALFNQAKNLGEKN